MPSIPLSGLNMQILLRKIIEFSLEGILFMLAVCVSLWLLRHKTAALRHAVLSFAMLGLIALPAASLVLPNWNLNLVPSGFLAGPEALSVQSFTSSAPGAADQSIPAPATGRREQTQPEEQESPAAQSGTQRFDLSAGLPALLLAAWLLAALAFLVRPLIGKRNVRRIIDRAEPVGEGKWRSILEEVLGRYHAKKKIEVFSSGDVKVPVVVGIGAPILLIPADGGMWSEESIRASLLHELAHIKRGDLFNQLLAQVACALHWINPLAWFASQRLFVERERASDDFVINFGVRAADYARDLLQASRYAKLAKRRAVFNIASMARGTDFKDRMLNVLDPSAIRKPLSTGGSIMIALIITGLILPLAAFSPWAADGYIPALGIDAKQITNQDHALALLQNPDYRVRVSALAAFERVSRPEAVDGLIDVAVEAMKDESYLVRLSGVNTLAKVAEPDGYPDVVAVCVLAIDDEYTPVQLNATNILVRLKNPGSVPGLREACTRAVQSDYHPLRQNAMRILASISAGPVPTEDMDSSSDERIELDENQAQILVELLGGDNALLRYRAVLQVLESSNFGSFPGLVDALVARFDDPDERVREKAVWAIARLGDPGMTDALVNALADSSLVVQIRAITGLSELATNGSIEALIRMLGHDSGRLRERAAWALGEIGDSRAHEALWEVLRNDSNDTVRERAAWALSRIDYDPEESRRDSDRRESQDRRY